MRKAYRVLLGLGLALVLPAAACEKSEPEVKQASFCEEYAKRECAAVAPPCAASPTQCEAVRTADCQTRTAALLTAQYTTRAFHPENVAACLAKVSETYKAPTVSGAALKELDAVCNRVYQGNAKLLEACQVDFDCAGTLICDPAKLLCGEKRVVPAGGQCANVGDVCSPGEFCRPLGASYLCSPRAAKAAACGEGGPCLESLLCREGACVEKSLPGTACIKHDDCQTGYCSISSNKCASSLIFGEGTDACRLYVGAFSAPDAGADAF
jgi:hypothetical protein